MQLPYACRVHMSDVFDMTEAKRVHKQLNRVGLGTRTHNYVNGTTSM